MTFIEYATWEELTYYNYAEEMAYINEELEKEVG